MAHFFNEPSRTFSEYLLIPGYTSEECIPANVSLRTPLVKYRKGVEEPALSLNIPMTSAVTSPSPMTPWPSLWPRKAASASSSVLRPSKIRPLWSARSRTTRQALLFPLPT